LLEDISNRLIFWKSENANGKVFRGKVDIISDHSPTSEDKGVLSPG
jgi:hypothetical protein